SYVCGYTGFAEDSILCFINVDNCWEDSVTYKYRLMQVHFPFFAMNADSICSTPTPGYTPVDRLTMASYELKYPAEYLKPTLPEYSVLPNSTPLQKKLYNGNPSFPFHLYYHGDCEFTEPEDCNGVYFAVYNSFGYPCKVNFAKNKGDGNEEGTSFYLDVVQYPRVDGDGHDMLDAAGLDFEPAPGYLFEFVFGFKGNWYHAAEYYREVTEDVMPDLAATPVATPPWYVVTPVWNVTPMPDGPLMPDWAEKSPMYYYISPQICETDFYQSGDHPMEERVDKFKKYYFTNSI
ncbi:MAG TPA: hypothetical protein PLV45_18500, partial [bacterium]|nr:hypothetical protein [bacterium]